MNKEKVSRIISPVMLLMAAMIWGFAFTAQKAAEKVPVFTMGASRSLFAFVFLFLTVIAFDKINHTGRSLLVKKEGNSRLNSCELIGGAICGTVLALASFFQQSGINAGTDAGKASFITSLYVILVPVYALFMKKKAPLNVWISILVAVVGFYLLCITGDFGVSRSDLFVIISSLIFPIHIIAIDAYSPRCDGIRMSMVQFFVCTCVNLIFMLLFERPIDLSPVVDAILPLLFLGVCSSGIAYTLQILGQRGVNPAAASIIMSLESVFGVIGAAIVLGERMSRREYLGCAVVFAAVVLSQIDFKRIIKSKGE